MLVFINFPSALITSKLFYRRSYLYRFFILPKKFCTYEGNGKKQTFYEVLGVSKEATPQEIKSAYYDLSKQFHPDSMSKEKDFNEAALKFLQVGEAYEILGSKEKRNEYDRQLSYNEGLNQPGRSGNDISRDLQQYQEFRNRWRKGKGSTTSYQQEFNHQFYSKFRKEYKYDQKDFDKFYELYKKRQKADSDNHWELKAKLEAQRLDSSEESAILRKQKYDEFYGYRDNSHGNSTFPILVGCLMLSSGILVYIWFQSN